MIKKVFIIREKTTKNILVKYRTVTGKLNKAIFNTRVGAKLAIESQIKKHYMLGQYDWYVEEIGQEFKLTNNQ